MSQKHDLLSTWKMTFHKSAPDPACIMEEWQCFPSTQSSCPHLSMYTLISNSSLCSLSEAIFEITISHISRFPQLSLKVSALSSFYSCWCPYPFTNYWQFSYSLTNENSHHANPSFSLMKNSVCRLRVNPKNSPYQR